MTRRFKSVDNSDRGEKVVIRHNMLAYIPTPSVLECFAGSGHIHQECYKELPYLGLDLKPVQDGRKLLNIDNRQFLRSADLSSYNFFDLDAYGTPWHQFLIILKRRFVSPGESIAIALTDGLNFKIRMSGLPDGLRPYVGLPPKMLIPCLNVHQQFINALVVTGATRSAGLKITHAWQGQNARKNMRYYGIILKKV